MKSRALPSEQPCCSQTLLQPDQCSNTEIFHVPLPFLPTCRPPPQVRGHHLAGQSNNSPETHSMVVTAERRGSQHWGTSPCSATSSWYPAEHQWYGSNPTRQAELLSLIRSPGLLIAGFPTLCPFAFLSALMNFTNSQRALKK